MTEGNAKFVGAAVASERPTPERAPPQNAPDRPPCVLVAEDEDMVRDLAVRVLRSHGMRVLAARHGGEAVALFLSQPSEIDAVLLDLTMPVMHGSEVLATLKRVCPELGVVVTSGYSESDSYSETDDASVRFLQKPYRAHTLVAGIEAVLPARRSATPAP